MTIPVLLILAAMWAAVLVPPILRARSAQRSTDTIGSFRHSLSALGSRIGRHGHHHQSARSSIDSLARLHPNSLTPANEAAGRPPEMTPMQRRRRDVLVGLAGATSVTMLLAMAVGSTLAWFLWALSASALGAYVYLLLRMKQARLDRTRTVHVLDARRQPVPAAPQFAFARRSGS